MPKIDQNDGDDAGAAVAASVSHVSVTPPDANSAMVKLHHIEFGESDWMYRIDARQALAAFPNEWSATPWSDAERDAWAKAQKAAAKA